MQPCTSFDCWRVRRWLSKCFAVLLMKEIQQKHRLIWRRSDVSYCWWFRNPANQLRLVVYPIIYGVLYIPGWCWISEPSTVPWTIQGHVGFIAQWHPGIFWKKTVAVLGAAAYFLKGNIYIYTRCLSIYVCDHVFVYMNVCCIYKSCLFLSRCECDAAAGWSGWCWWGMRGSLDVVLILFFRYAKLGGIYTPWN